MTENIYQEYADPSRPGDTTSEEIPWATPLSAPPAKRDACAVGSAICGFTGFIPVITQIIGMGLALIAITRIRRARVLGREIAGMRHAVMGLAMNGATLLIWIVLFAATSTIFHSFSSTTDQLSKLFPGP